MFPAQDPSAAAEQQELWPLCRPFFYDYVIAWLNEIGVGVHVSAFTVAEQLRALRADGNTSLAGMSDSEMAASLFPRAYLGLIGGLRFLTVMSGDELAIHNRSAAFLCAQPGLTPGEVWHLMQENLTAPTSLRNLGPCCTALLQVWRSDTRRRAIHGRLFPVQNMSCATQYTGQPAAAFFGRLVSQSEQFVRHEGPAIVTDVVMAMIAQRPMGLAHVVPESWVTSSQSESDSDDNGPGAAMPPSPARRRSPPGSPPPSATRPRHR
jgi:hypothetical protein